MIKINLARPRIQLAIYRLPRRDIDDAHGNDSMLMFFTKINLRRAGFDLDKPYTWKLDFNTYQVVFTQMKGDQNEKQRDTEAKGRRFNLLHRMSKIRV